MPLAVVDRMKNSEYKFSNALPQKQVESLLGTCNWPAILTPCLKYNIDSSCWLFLKEIVKLTFKTFEYNP